MRREQFEQIDKELLAAADKVLLQRRGAYAQDGDVLMNFKQVAQATGLPVAKVWEVYFRKALNAACQVVAGGEVAGESREERMVDLLNYVRLGNAISRMRDGYKQANINDIQDETLRKKWTEFIKERPIPYFPDPSALPTRDALKDYVALKARNRFTD